MSWPNYMDGPKPWPRHDGPPPPHLSHLYQMGSMVDEPDEVEDAIANLVILADNEMLGVSAAQMLEEYIVYVNRPHMYPSGSELFSKIHDALVGHPANEVFQAMGEKDEDFFND